MNSGNISSPHSSKHMSGRIGAKSATLSGESPRVLLVDDEIPFLKGLSKLLVHHDPGFEVIMAGNGREAMALLSRERIEVLVTDLRMPGIDGYQLLDFVKRHHPKIPVIVITAVATETIRDRADNLGALYFLQKPFEFEEFVARVREGLALRNSGFTQSVVSLPSVIRIIIRDKKTCTLVIKQGKETGLMYFDNGDLLQCECGERTGEAAVVYIASWAMPAITIFDRCARKIKRILTPVSELLKAKPDHRNPGDNGSQNHGKEEIMQAKKIMDMVNILKEDLGDALIATDIWAVGDGRSIAAHNPQPKASALFNRMSKYLVNSLQEAEFPPLDSYYYLNLQDGIVALVLMLDDYQQGMLVNTKEFEIGLLLNITVPKLLKTFEEAKKE